MEANELRLGTSIKFCNSDRIVTVNPQVIQRIFNGSEDYEPIPLTEEWLLKFGFESSVGFEDQKYDPDDEYANQFEYTLDSGISHRDFICCPSKGWVIKIGDYDDELEIRYVHEFQNLFFALKGKELTL